MKRILIIFLILIGLYILFTSNFTNWFTSGKDNAEAKLTNSVKDIDIDASAIRATIIPEKRNNIKAELNGKGNVSVKKNGDTIKVEYHRNWLNNFTFFNKTPKLNIYIPEDYNRRMAIDISAGFLTFEGPSEKRPMVLEKLVLDMSSGKTDLKNLEIAEYVHDGSSGMVTIDHITTETSNIDMTSGYIKIKNYTGKLDAEVSSGKLDIQMDKLENQVDVRATSGHVNLDLPDHADFTLKGKFSSGLIRSSLPLTDEIHEKNRIEGVSGSGKHLVNVTVSSGMVDIH